jgi:hypothetical protein
MRVQQKRRKHHRLPNWRLWGSLASVLWLASPAPQVMAEESKQPSSQTADAPTQEEPIVYEPPMRGAPESRVGGATRGIDIQSDEDQGPVAAILAPKHTGLTVSEQPTLYWFVSKTSFVRIEVAREVEGSYRTVLQVDYPQAVASGINAFSFADYNMLLQVGTDYRWSLIILGSGDGEDGELASSGTIRRVLPHESLMTKLSQNVDVSKFYTLAEEGVWYDAVDELSKAIAADPDNSHLRERRAELLDQVDLPAVAAYERQ